MVRLSSLHVIPSLVSSGSGLLLISALFGGHRTPRLNSIFLVVAGTKLPVLHRATPAGTEPVVGVTDGLALLVYFVVAVMALRCSLYRRG